MITEQAPNLLRIFIPWITASYSLTMTAMNRLRGPKIGKAHWSIWTWLVLMTIKNLQMGGIIGGVALILHVAFPATPVWIFVIALGIIVSALVSLNYYVLIEKAAVVMIGLFTVFTLASLLMLQFTDDAVAMSDLANGLSFQLPKHAVIFAVAAFGITGVGGDEIMVYNYWLIEKGYARHTGPDDGTEAWVSRAKGWMRVMYLDALLSMVIYTVVTAAFYLLGAAILNTRGMVPEKTELVATLSKIYTETLGGGANSIFLVGAFVVLFSTLFAALAAWTRLFGDAFGQIGLYQFENSKHRAKAISCFAWAFPINWGVLYLAMEVPGFMVVIGGVTTTFILLLVVYAAIDFRYRRMDPRLKPSRFYDAALWISIASIAAVASKVVVELLARFFQSA